MPFHLFFLYDFFLSLFLNVPFGGVKGKGLLEKVLMESSFIPCFAISVSEKHAIGEKKDRKACLLTVYLTERVPPFLRRNLVVHGKDVVPNRSWEPKSEPSFNLRKRDFRYADFAGSDLHKIDFSFANLEMADLHVSGLEDAHLFKTNLKGANLERAKLQHADLRKADFQGAHLRLAKLQGADLKEAEFQGAHLRLANLQGANLKEANFQGADLEKANLQSAILEEAEFQGTDLFRANLQGAILKKAYFQGAGLILANLQGADLKKANFQGAILRMANLQGAVLLATDFQGAVLSAAKFQGSILLNTRVWMAKKFPSSLPQTGTAIVFIDKVANKIDEYTIKYLINRQFMKARLKSKYYLYNLLNKAKQENWRNSEYYYNWEKYSKLPDFYTFANIYKKYGITRAKYTCSFLPDLGVNERAHWIKTLLFRFKMIENASLVSDLTKLRKVLKKRENHLSFESAVSAYRIAQTATATAIWRICPYVLEVLSEMDKARFEMLVKKAEKTLEAADKRILGAGK